ncbi:hypothetical protein DYB28_005845 [Aphanomyces astaci]|uniref:Uncharacterized protein n=1 Tax=Aphanomyces astaci TaxID=112090 RepID=A0A9X8DRC2_APHAT|nr:hypothetical protein DYB28_005845 [Aphanomyces astaci]
MHHNNGQPSATSVAHTANGQDYSYSSPHVGLSMLQDTFKKIDQKLETVLDAQDAKFRSLEASLARGRSRVEAMEKQLGHLPAVTVDAVTTHVMPHLVPPSRDTISSDPSSGSFAWSDGTTRLAPETWQFPTPTCRSLWTLWFYGATSSSPPICPFRLLKLCDVRDFHSKRQLRDARLLMRHFITTAIATDTTVASEASLHDLPLDTSLSIFDRTFDLILLAHPDNLADHLHAKDPTLLPFRAVFDALPSELKDKLTPPPNEDAPSAFTWSDGTQRVTPEGWVYPSELCKSMWLRWFLGVPEVGLGPLRCLRSGLMKVKPCRQQTSNNNVLWRKLSDVAIAHGFAESFDDLKEMLEIDLGICFDRAFDILLFHNPDGNLFGPHRVATKRPTSYVVSSIHRLLTKGTGIKRKDVPPDDDEADDGRFVELLLEPPVEPPSMRARSPPNHALLNQNIKPTHRQNLDQYDACNEPRTGIPASSSSALVEEFHNDPAPPQHPAFVARGSGGGFSTWQHHVPFQPPPPPPSSSLPLLPTDRQVLETKYPQPPYYQYANNRQ